MAFKFDQGPALRAHTVQRLHNTASRPPPVLPVPDRGASCWLRFLCSSICSDPRCAAGCAGIRIHRSGTCVTAGVRAVDIMWRRAIVLVAVAVMATIVMHGGRWCAIAAPATSSSPHSTDRDDQRPLQGSEGPGFGPPPGPYPFPSAMPQPVVFDTTPGGIVAGLDVNSLRAALDVSGVLGDGSVVSRAYGRFLARIRAGTAPGHTLPYLRVRYPPLRRHSAVRFDNASVDLHTVQYVLRNLARLWQRFVD